MKRQHICIVCALVLWAMPAWAASEADQLRAENKRLADQVRVLDARLDAADARCKALEAQLKSGTASDAQDRKRIRELTDENNRLERALDACRRQVQELEGQLKNRDGKDAAETQRRIRELTEDNTKLGRELDGVRKHARELEAQLKARDSRDSTEAQGRIRELTADNARLKRELDEAQKRVRENPDDKVARDNLTRLRALDEENGRLRQKLQDAERLQREQQAGIAKPRAGEVDPDMARAMDQLRADLAAVRERLAREQALRDVVALPAWSDQDQVLSPRKLVGDSLSVYLPASDSPSLVVGEVAAASVTLVDAQGDHAKVVTLSLRDGQLWLKWASEVAASRHAPAVRGCVLAVVGPDGRTITLLR